MAPFGGCVSTAAGWQTLTLRNWPMAGKRYGGKLSKGSGPGGNHASLQGRGVRLIVKHDGVRKRPKTNREGTKSAKVHEGRNHQKSATARVFEEDLLREPSRSSRLCG
jgi:hypothetical protein